MENEIQRFVVIAIAINRNCKSFKEIKRGNIENNVKNKSK